MATKVSVRIARKCSPKVVKTNRVSVYPVRRETISLLELITGVHYGVDKEIIRKKHVL